MDYYKLTQGIYIHIPHCLQKCHYCDFATTLLSSGPSLDEYCEGLLKELEFQALPSTLPLSSIYFGGGTPSLLGSERLIKVIQKIKEVGYTVNSHTEITIEINPGTLSPLDMDRLIEAGVNRFSLGVQTLFDKTLKALGREHSRQDSLKTLKLLKSYGVSFSADLMLALPQESFEDFQITALSVLEYEPNHLSVYILTVPENHFLNSNIPDDLLDDLLDQTEPFLNHHQFFRYEISNYRHHSNNASKHNLLYWSDRPYWGIGLGAHSYFPHLGDWGVRFWNPRTYKAYLEKALTPRTAPFLPPQKFTEALQLNESITDYNFTHLRQFQGISIQDLSTKYPPSIVNEVFKRLQILKKSGYILSENSYWKLTSKGKKFADTVFRELCFSSQPS